MAQGRSGSPAHGVQVGSREATMLICSSPWRAPTSPAPSRAPSRVCGAGLPASLRDVVGTASRLDMWDNGRRWRWEPNE